MPNISFEEKQGASLLRRIFAALWFIAVFAAAVIYVNLTPREYRGSMELCFNSENKGAVLAEVEQILQENEVTGVTIDDIESEKLILAGKAATPVEIKDNLLAVRKMIAAAVQDGIDKRYAALAEKYNAEFAGLKDRLTQAAEGSMESKENLALIDEVEAAVKTRQPLPAGWEVMFEDNARLNSILAELVENVAAMEELEITLKTEAAKMLVLSEWLNDPQNQTVQITEKRIVQYNDSPELIALKDKRAAIEASRMRLLIRATSRHPQVIKMTEELAELDAQINALTRNPQMVEDIKEITNPKLAACKTEIVSNRALIAGLNSELETLISKTVMRLGDLRLLVNDAQKDIMDGKQEKIEHEIALMEKNSIEKEQSLILGYVISGTVQRLNAPDLFMIYSLAAFAGLAGAILLMYSRKKSKFRLEEVEATPEFPVLGRIGRIGGSVMTDSQGK